ncbi:MAG: gamma-glutamyl-gamma-aminobutyrate hydrolase family protein, partial [Desulfovibrionaceae bacterium]|nr:gamma-glutamyl-gamma-aminobutyrate hydrolase family protein [Desulfovibrionaceae bacterium]
MFLLIDNYDSFTYNLVQAFYSLDLDPYVVQNDDPNLLDLALRKDLEMVCISPGPGRPEEAGFCLKFLEALDPKVPVLGICLGHQILGCFAGAKVVNCPQIMHGKQSEITHEGEGLFKDLPDKMVVGRYHSLMVADEPSPKYAFKVTARGPRGEIMALNYQDRPWAGLQFHPESILTPLGMELLAHFPAALKQKEDDQVKIKEVLENLAQGQDLKPEQASFGFAKLMDGELSEAQAGSLLLTLRLKGESSLELAEAARQALKRAVPVPEIKEPHIDVVGTGGDGKHSFNCSTATSLVLAGLGYLVSKHGNRAVSSTCGSADAIQGLGLPMHKEPLQILAE